MEIDISGVYGYSPNKATRCSEARPCSGGGRRVTAADGRISTQQLSGAARRRATPVYAGWTITTITGLCVMMLDLNQSAVGSVHGQEIEGAE